MHLDCCWLGEVRRHCAWCANHARCHVCMHWHHAGSWKPAMRRPMHHTTHVGRDRNMWIGRRVRVRMQLRSWTGHSHARATTTTTTASRSCKARGWHPVRVCSRGSSYTPGPTWTRCRGWCGYCRSSRRHCHNREHGTCWHIAGRGRHNFSVQHVRRMVARQVRGWVGGTNKRTCTTIGGTSHGVHGLRCSGGGGGGDDRSGVGSYTSVRRAVGSM